MKLKTLLLGTAALAVYSPVMAADAIVIAEPEPVEYVRVCDAFGEGYFYIPGTETCLKISGEVRMRVIAPSRASILNYDEDTDTVSLDLEGGDSYTTAARARVTFDAKSDTALGELHGRLRLQGENDGTPTTDAEIGLDQAYLQLGGLFAGYSESAWATTTNGGLSGFGGKGIYDGAYGYQQRNMLQYQLTGTNYFAAISLEDDADATSWVPDVVGRLGAVFGGVTVFGVVGYDQDNGKDDDVWTTLGGADVGAGTSEFGVKLGLNADVGMAGNLIVQGFYASGTTSYGANASYLGQSWTPEWSVLAAYGHDFSPELTAYINGQYFADFYNTNNTSTNLNAWAVSGGFAWTPVENFSVTTEAKYLNVDSADVVGLGTPENEEWEFVLQLQRSF